MAKSTTKSVSSKVENSFRDGGCYHAIVATLLKMGTDKQHAYEGFATRLKADWEGYKGFAKKEARNEATGKDAAAKLLQNVKVLQRKDYGAPLHDQNACIDMGYEGTKLWIRLNSKSKNPLSSGRAPKEAAPVVVKAAKVVKASKAVAKATKPLKATSKATTPILSGADAIAFLKGGKKKAAK